MKQLNSELIKGDLLNSNDIIRATTSVDIIHHFEAAIGVKYYVENP